MLAHSLPRTPNITRVAFKHLASGEVGVVDIHTQGVLSVSGKRLRHLQIFGAEEITSDGKDSCFVVALGGEKCECRISAKDNDNYLLVDNRKFRLSFKLLEKTLANGRKKIALTP